MGDPLSGPSGSSALLDALQWVQGMLLGTLATTVAVIAVAWIGIGMLNGRINVQRGATVILGCFIVFGAPSIVSGLITAAETIGAASEPIIASAPSVSSPPAPLPTPTPHDPYAGASVPVR